ncbi:MAG TPA: 50S ribosomal protein L9, partial [Chlamydiales bacterium]|nr:50S ribosomal protein L9 [Chlamydiales bacterium]
GEIVNAKRGYIRNFLLPKNLGVIATTNMLRKQERLRAERDKQAIIDRKESEELAKQIEAINLETKVKVDLEGHMYGSVSAANIATLFQERGLPLERRNIGVTKPIKTTGAHKIPIKLKEGVELTVVLHILPEGVNMAGIENVVKPLPVEESSQAPEAPKV